MAKPLPGLMLETSPLFFTHRVSLWHKDCVLCQFPAPVARGRSVSSSPSPFSSRSAYAAAPLQEETDHGDATSRP